MSDGSTSGVEEDKSDSTIKPKYTEFAEPKDWPGTVGVPARAIVMCEVGAGAWLRSSQVFAVQFRGKYANWTKRRHSRSEAK